MKLIERYKNSSWVIAVIYPFRFIVGQCELFYIQDWQEHNKLSGCLFFLT